MALLPGTLVAALGSWLIASSLWIYPHSLSYFNESIAGPLNGPRYLLGSNVDWAQDALYMRDWLTVKPLTKPVFIAPSRALKSRAGGQFRSRAFAPSTATQPIANETRRGWYVISVNELYGKQLILLTPFGNQRDPIAIGRGERALLRRSAVVSRIAYSLVVVDR